MNLFSIALAILMALAPVSPRGGDASPAAVATLPSGASTAVTCEDFAQRQVNLAKKQLSKDNYNGALRVLNTTAQNCDIPMVRSQIDAVLDEWYRYIQNRGATSQIPRFINVVDRQRYLPNGSKRKFERRLLGDVGELVASARRAGRNDRAHTLCERFPAYADQTFTLNYHCGTAASEVKAYATAAEHYAWLLDNWSDDQSYLSWDDAARRLSDLYMVTTRFDEAFEISKRLAARNPEPDVLLKTLASVRGKFLEPIVHTGNVLLDGVTSDRAVRHVKSEFARINFPSYVESIYTVTKDLGADIAFYGADDAKLPSRELIDQSAGAVSLLTAGNGEGRAWLVTPVDAGYLVLQYARTTNAEENVILESLLGDVQSEEKWQSLYDYEFTSTYPATGSAVATLVGGAYLAGIQLPPYNRAFEDLPVLTYYCVQDQEGEIVESFNYTRSDIDYSEAEWNKTSKTPALYHHEVQRNGSPVREVVWPTYDDEQWSGVVRVGIISNN
jgi:hypothetical protein